MSRRSGAVTVAEGAVGDLICTVVFDFADQIIASGQVDTEGALAIANMATVRCSQGLPRS